MPTEDNRIEQIKDILEGNYNEGNCINRGGCKIFILCEETIIKCTEMPC